ncbi:MAG: radical SAM protein [Candidatus Omnitrophica bacterium]|nr:radical SAM protein [Candidatus Omnitrophota bacterium]
MRITKRQIRAGYKFISAKFLAKKVPLIVGWSITNRCNLHCLFCTRWKSQARELDTGQVCAIIDALSQMGTYGINFTGGEPLIREDIGMLLRYSKKKGINTRVFSNGLLVPGRIDELEGVDCLTMSLSGIEEKAGDCWYGASPSVIASAIDAAKKKNVYVKLHTVLTKDNLDRLDSILHFAKEHGAMVDFSVIEFLPFSEEQNIKPLLPSQKELKTALGLLISEKKAKNAEIGNSLASLKYLKQWPDQIRLECAAGKIFCRIEADGNVYPCAGLIRKVEPQNCLGQGLRSAFMKMKPVICDSCWCSTHIEMNYAYALNLSVILEIMKNYRL